MITTTRSAGTGTLQGTVTATTVNGIATFNNLSHNVATTITLNFAASGLTNATSTSIIVSPAAANQLVFTTQPNGIRTGSPLATQPVVAAQDAFGNTSTVGLPASFNLSLALTSGSGSLLGTTKRLDGTTEVTYAGHPLYYFIADHKPGDITGQDIDAFGGPWYVISPSGKQIV